MRGGEGGGVLLSAASLLVSWVQSDGDFNTRGLVWARQRVFSPSARFGGPRRCVQVHRLKESVSTSFLAWPFFQFTISVTLGKTSHLVVSVRVERPKTHQTVQRRRRGGELAVDNLRRIFP